MLAIRNATIRVTRWLFDGRPFRHLSHRPNDRIRRRCRSAGAVAWVRTKTPRGNSRSATWPARRCSVVLRRRRKFSHFLMAETLLNLFANWQHRLLYSWAIAARTSRWIRLRIRPSSSSSQRRPDSLIVNSSLIIENNTVSMTISCDNEK
jgi:hypothetical protein